MEFLWGRSGAMRYVRIHLPKLITCVIWALVVSLCYVVVWVQIMGILEPEYSVFSNTYYLEGICLIIPYMITKELALKSKNIIQYLCGSIVLIGGCLLLSLDYVFLVITIYLSITRLCGRVNGKEGELYELHYFVLLIFAMIYVYTTYQGDEFLQKATIYHGVIAGVLIHTHNSVIRLERYIEIRKSRAYMPVNRIVHTGIIYILVLLFTCMVVILPIMGSQYEYTQWKPWEFEPIKVAGEEVEESNKKPVEEDGGMNFNVDESEINPVLYAIWDITGKIAMYGTYIAILYWMLKGIYFVIIRFQGSKVEENDIIESLYTPEDQVLAIERVKRNLSEIFYVSEEMRIRKQYKKKLKKYNPKVWQTPTEMEEMANLEIKELHNRYEKARYGEKT